MAEVRRLSIANEFRRGVFSLRKPMSVGSHLVIIEKADTAQRLKVVLQREGAVHDCGKTSLKIIFDKHGYDW